MAEINIQKKGMNPMWWVLVILAVVIVGWLLMGRNDNRAPETSLMESPAAVPTAALHGLPGASDLPHAS
jgi:hypothetical protein